MNKQIGKASELNDSEIDDYKNKIKIVKDTIYQNEKDAVTSSKKISKYLTENLAIAENDIYKSKSKQHIKGLNASQTSIFKDLEKFDGHNQATIQRCFEAIYLYNNDIFETERGKLLENFETNLHQFEQQYLNDISNIKDIKSIISESKQQTDTHLSQIKSKITLLKTSSENMIIILKKSQ